jgi:glycosyltransferase involved in cell wall biosynthesis
VKIAVYHNLPSGGAKRSLFEYARRLASEDRLDVFTLTSADHSFGDVRPFVSRHEVLPFRPLPLLQPPLGRLNQFIRLLDLVRLRAVGRAVAQRIDQGGYDVALIEPCRIENCPSVLRFLRRTPSVFYCHEPLRLLYEHPPFRAYTEPSSTVRRNLDRIDPLPRGYRAALRETDRRNMRAATAVLANSDYTRLRLESIYRTEAHLCYPGVDTQLFRPRDLPRSRAVLAVGSLTPLKGHDLPIRALAKIPASQRPPLWIAANFENAPERAYLERLARDLGVDLRFHLAIEDERLVDLYNRAAFTISASIREPLGFAALESMACATAVVGVREGGIPEVIQDRRTGLLVGRTPEELSSAILRLLGDPALPAEYGRNGLQAVAEGWTWDAAVETLGLWLRRTSSTPFPQARSTLARHSATPGSLEP